MPLFNYNCVTLAFGDDRLGGWIPHCTSHSFVCTESLQLGLKPMEMPVIVEETAHPPHPQNPEANGEQLE